MNNTNKQKKLNGRHKKMTQKKQTKNRNKTSCLFTSLVVMSNEQSVFNSALNNSNRIEVLAKSSSSKTEFGFDVRCIRIMTSLLS